MKIRHYFFKSSFAEDDFFYTKDDSGIETVDNDTSDSDRRCNTLPSSLRKAKAKNCHSSFKRSESHGNLITINPKVSFSFFSPLIVTLLMEYSKVSI